MSLTVPNWPVKRPALTKYNFAVTDVSGSLIPTTECGLPGRFLKPYNHGGLEARPPSNILYDNLLHGLPLRAGSVSDGQCFSFVVGHDLS